MPDKCFCPKDEDAAEGSKVAEAVNERDEEFCAPLHLALLAGCSPALRMP